MRHYVVVLLLFAAGVLSIPSAALSSSIPQCDYRPDWSVFQRGTTVVEHFASHTGPPDAPGTRDAYRVLLPDVKVAFRSYDEIRLVRGDYVLIAACGCVQTGGKGKTWKRFVDPQGANSDSYYHGTIMIDGALAVTGVPLRRWNFNNHVFSYVRINDLLDAQKTSNGPVLRATGSTTLILGYEDDEYGDNGYWGHDDGTDGQCAGIGGAVVEVVVDHH